MTTPAYYEVPESAWMFRDAPAARPSTDAKWSPTPTATKNQINITPFGISGHDIAKSFHIVIHPHSVLHFPLVTYHPFLEDMPT